MEGFVSGDCIELLLLPLEAGSNALSGDGGGGHGAALQVKKNGRLLGQAGVVALPAVARATAVVPGAGAEAGGRHMRDGGLKAGAAALPTADATPLFWAAALAGVGPAVRIESTDPALFSNV
eukprot:SAG22_NODE_6895_length_797_cov_2.196275_2_plen_122_part_00